MKYVPLSLIRLGGIPQLAMYAFNTQITAVVYSDIQLVNFSTEVLSCLVLCTGEHSNGVKRSGMGRMV